MVNSKRWSISALAGGGETGKEMERDGERKRSRGRENRGQRSERAARSQAWAPPCLGFPSLRSLSPCPALGALLGTPHGASSRAEWQPGAPDRRPFLSTDRVIMRILHLGSEKLSDLFKVTLGGGRVWIQPSSGWLHLLFPNLSTVREESVSSLGLSFPVCNRRLGQTLGELFLSDGKSSNRVAGGKERTRAGCSVSPPTRRRD